MKRVCANFEQKLFSVSFFMNFLSFIERNWFLSIERFVETNWLFGHIIHQLYAEFSQDYDSVIFSIPQPLELEIHSKNEPNLTQHNPR